MYGDGWTPLMACCVAGHLGIAQVLLRQARQDVRSLVLSANRYGLTAGHIAARRGDVYLLDLLLDAAGSAVSKVHLSSYFLSRSPPLFLARHLGSHTSCWLLSKQMAIEQTVRLQVPLELPSLSGIGQVILSDTFLRLQCQNATAEMCVLAGKRQQRGDTNNSSSEVQAFKRSPASDRCHHWQAGGAQGQIHPNALQHGHAHAQQAQISGQASVLLESGDDVCSVHYATK